MSFVRALTCKECGTAYPVVPRMICDECFGPLEVSYDYAAMRGAVTRDADRVGAALAVALPRAAADRGRAARPACTRASRRSCARTAWAASWASRELYLKDDAVNHPTLQLQGPRGVGGRSRARWSSASTRSAAPRPATWPTPSPPTPPRPGSRPSSSSPTTSRRARSWRRSSIGRPARAIARQLRRRQPPVHRGRRRVRLGDS